MRMNVDPGFGWNSGLGFSVAFGGRRIYRIADGGEEVEGGGLGKIRKDGKSGGDLFEKGLNLRRGFGSRCWWGADIEDHQYKGQQEGVQ